MASDRPPSSNVAALVFNLLNPIPTGFFVAALLFDATYANTAVVMWFKAAAWLIAAGLLFAVIPRFINLSRVWFSRNRSNSFGDKAAFFLNLLAVIAAITNAFVHSRDAYAVVPDGLWLSIITVILLAAGNVLLTLQNSNSDQ